MSRAGLARALFSSAALILPAGVARAQVLAASDKPILTNVADVAPTPSRTTVEEVIVHSASRKTTGGGLIKEQIVPKSVSTVSSAFIQSQPALQNAYQYVQLTPGALVSTTDPYGLSEQGSINIHGLGQDELGYVLEGMPLNDIGYYTAYPSQFIDSENIDEISLAQGSADLDSPVISAAGGLMNITMLDPSVRPGGNVDASYGSYNTNREFIRLDSGLIGNTGVRGFISYSHTGSDDWHGPGRVDRQHIDFKLVKEWGENRITLTGTLHNGVTPTYVQPTLANFQLYGAGGSNATNNYNATFTPGDYNYWRLHVGTFRIAYFSAPARLKVADNVTLNVTPYAQYGYGNSPYGTVLSEDGNYQGLSASPYHVNIPNFAANGGAIMADYQDLQYRAGLIGKVTYKMGPGSLIAGFWYDYADETDTQPYSSLSATGTPSDIWVDSSKGLLRLPTGQLLLAGQDHVITQVNELFVAEVIHLLDDRLTIEAGVKEAFVFRNGTNGVPGPQYRAIIDNRETLPRAAARYQIDSKNQVFASVTTNFRTPSEATMFNAYGGGSVTTQPYIYSAANTNLKAEYSISEDVGYRYTGPILNASVSFFNYNFTNRQVATLFGGSFVNQSINAGSQTTRGVDIEAGTRPWRHISPYVSAEYLYSKINDDLPSQDANGNPIILATAGKTAVRSPKIQAALGLTYDDGDFFGNFNVKYASSQFSTFTNDEKIPGYATANLSLGARLPPIGLKARPELKLNLTNLAGNNYLSGVANPTPTAGGATYYLSGGFAALFTVSQAF